MVDNWAKWDAEHGRGEGDGKERSADKLAKMIKDTVGHKGGQRGASVHGSGGSVAHKTTKADLKRPAPVKGEKDAADSHRTKIRMAAHYRGKKGEEPAVGKIEPEPGNTGKIRSADKLASAIKTSGGGGVDRSAERAQRLAGEGKFAYPKAKNEAHAASQVASLRNTPELHREASAAHTKAGNLARPGSEEQLAHDASARMHRSKADSLNKSKPPAQVIAETMTRSGGGGVALASTKPKAGSASADKLAASRDKKVKDDYTAARKDAIHQEAKADLSGSADDHRTAVAAHTKAASLATTKAQRDMHLARASSSSTKAVDAANVRTTSGGAVIQTIPFGGAAAGPADMRAADAQTAKDRAATLRSAEGKAPAAKASREADEATKRAEASPTADSHKAAMEAHSKAFDLLVTDKKTMKANESAISYHNAMRTYHHYANDPARPKPGVLEEHSVPGVGKVDRDAATSEFMGPEHRAAASAAYKSVAEVRKTGATPEELNSIKDYTWGSDKLINDTLRSGPHPNPKFAEEADQHIAHLDSAFAKQSGLKSDVTTFRGVHKADQMFGPVGSKVGDHFVDHGFSSTSVHPDVAATFGSRSQGGALLRIHTAAGTKVLNPAGAGGFGRAEKEILMPRGSSYHIVADRQVRLKNGMMQRQIDLEHKGAK